MNYEKMITKHPFHIALEILINSSKLKYLTWLEHEERLRNILSRADLYHIVAGKLNEVDSILSKKGYLHEMYKLTNQYHDVHIACQIEDLSGGVIYRDLVMTQEKDDKWTQKRHVHFTHLL